MKVASDVPPRNAAEDDDLPKASGERTRHPPAEDPTPDAEPKIRLMIRSLRGPEVSGLVIEDSSARAAFERALATDVAPFTEPVITWTQRDQAIALDFDRPESAAPLRDVEVEEFATASETRPAFAWASHRRGLRLVFIEEGGFTAVALAGAWLMLTPLRMLAGWTLEVKTDSRHPAGQSDGSTCGRVFRLEPSSQISLRDDHGTVGEAATLAWLEERALSMGRHGGERCPWACGPNSGNPPVLIDANGVRCFRCQNRGSWPEIILGEHGARGPGLYRAARSLVHVAHQQHVIRSWYPNVPRDLMWPAWALVLRRVNADRLHNGDEGQRSKWEKRVASASSSAPPIARSSSGGWLDARTLLPRGKVSADKTLKFLPWCLWPPMIDEAEDSGPLEGFVPLHPIGGNEVIGPGVCAPPGTVFVRRPSTERDGGEVDVSRRPTVDEVAEAWVALETALPGFSRGYHFAILVAMLVAQRAVGTPPIICATGQSGSGKTAHVQAAAGALGSKAIQIALGSTEDTTRKVGLALEEGAGVIFADEIGRVEGLFAKLEPILSANSILAFRPKYANERRVSMRAAIMLLGSTLPEAIVRSPELSRRAVGYRLSGAHKVWLLEDTIAGKPLDLSEARSVDALRAPLDTITAHAWTAVHDLGPMGDWRQLLLDQHGAVPLPNLDLVDTDGEARNKAILDLYEAYRTAGDDGLSTAPGHAGWLIADPGTPPGEHLSVLVDLDAERPRFIAATSDLERLHLAPILGFSKPQVQLCVRKRSPHILVKFIVVNTMRGRGPSRTELPPATRSSPATESRGKETVTL